MTKYVTPDFPDIEFNSQAQAQQAMRTVRRDF